MASGGGSGGSSTCDGKTSGRLKLKRKTVEKLECQSKKAKIIPTPGMPNAPSSIVRQRPTNSPGEDTCSLDEGDRGDHAEHYGSDESQSKTSVVEMLTPRTPTAASTPKPKHPSEARKYPCTHPDCPKSFNRPAKLADHMRSHSGDRPFKCTYDGCDKSFMRRTSLKDHIQSLHTCVRDYVCQWEGCDKKFRTSTKLKRHTAIHEGHERFRCSGYPPCSEYFRKHQTLQRHISSVHLGQKPFPCTKIDPVTNGPCTQGFMQSTHLRTHIIRYHGGIRFWCHECKVPALEVEGGREEPRELGFYTYELFEKHKRLVHPPNCALCPKVCSTQSELRRHIEAQHQDARAENTRAYVCEINGCDRGFTTRSSLRVHVRSTHEQVKPFRCGETDLANSKIVEGWDGQGACGKKFGAKRTLEEHVRIHHMGLEPMRKRKAEGSKKGEYMAGESVKGSSTIAKLTGVGYEESRHIPCLYPSCPNRFMRQFDLERHMKSKHGLTDGDIVELLVEKEALSGGRFWFGADIQDEEYWDWTLEATTTSDRRATAKGSRETAQGIGEGSQREDADTCSGLQRLAKGDKLASQQGDGVADRETGDSGSDSEILIDPALRSLRSTSML